MAVRRAASVVHRLVRPAAAAAAAPDVAALFRPPSARAFGSTPLPATPLLSLSRRASPTAGATRMSVGGPAAWQATDGAWRWLVAAAAAAAVAGGAAMADRGRCEDATALPTYTAADVAKHNSASKRIWVYYKDGVYDITDFVAAHPGGQDKIMMAAGKSVEPFWALYRQHLDSKVQEILAEYRIGNLDTESIAQAAAAAAAADADDPYRDEPLPRHPALKVTCDQPFNAETPTTLITDHYITPSELWYVRHHHPVPNIDPATCRLKIGGGDTGTISVGLKELKEWYPKRTVVATTQCAGNRRSELNNIGKTQGLAWGIGTLSTAEWGGAYVRDILASVGIPDIDTALAKGIKHVQFIGGDEPYDGSVPVEIALDPRRPVLIAYEMNGEPVPREHGGPLRAVVPGCLGARSVKWVTRVEASPVDAASGWQRGFPYKAMSPNLVDFNGVDPTSLPSVYDLPVQSAIVSPAPGAIVERVGSEKKPTVEVSGYAWSGGGRGIVRVDVSADNGETWTTAELGRGSEQQYGQAWAWTMWTCEVPLPARSAGPQGGPVKLVCKAVDESMNVQPDTAKGIWNLRGILNNSWHRLSAQVASDRDEDDD